MNILITGGTGSVGKEIVRIIRSYGNVERIVVYSRDENKHSEMMKEFCGESKLRYMVGDICDLDRLQYAMNGCHIVFHAAAMKHIDKCEYNPTESIKVNILGTMNVANSCTKSSSVTSAMFISTDKACNPVSAYGAQKYAAERLWISMNNMSSRVKYNVVRYGNVLGSRGSFIHYWRKIVDDGGPIPITDDRMTRFFWTIREAATFAVMMCMESMSHQERGVVYVPKMGSIKMIDLAKSVSSKINVIGKRCPEKIHEELISEYESNNAYIINNNHYAIYPEFHPWCSKIERRGEKCLPGLSLTSKII